MSRKKDHGISPQVSPEQVGEIMAPILGEILKADPAAVQRQIGRKKKFAAEFQRLLCRQEIIAAWEAFYFKYFEIDVDLSGIRIPDDPGGFERVLIVVQGLTFNQAFDVCAAKFLVYNRIEDFECRVSANERNPIVCHYTILVRDRVEADKELMNRSAEWIKEKKFTTETLLERFIHELKFFDETGRHLDIENQTLCSGSRFLLGGYVPSALWINGMFKVCWRNLWSDNPRLRAREVVS